MELYIKEIDNIIATEYLMKDIKLCALALSDDSLKKLDQGQGYCPPPCSMTGFYNKKDELVCFMQATLFTESTLLIHVFLRSDLHHSGILRPITKQYSEYIHKHAPDVKKASESALWSDEYSSIIRDQLYNNQSKIFDDSSRSNCSL